MTAAVLPLPCVKEVEEMSIADALDTLAYLHRKLSIYEEEIWEGKRPGSDLDWIAKERSVLDGIKKRLDLPPE
jgi:hypothetical protein